MLSALVVPHLLTLGSLEVEGGCGSHFLRRNEVQGNCGHLCFSPWISVL